jgi:CAAX protease family protein
MSPPFAELTNFWLANLMTSLLFLAIHLPGWIALHTLNAPAALTVAVFGFVMGLAVKWSDSLWAAIVAHSANDFLSFVVFRL